MKIVRIRHKGRVEWGILKDKSITLLKDAPFKGIKLRSAKLSASKVKLLAPVNPSKVICVGLNYRDHAKELKMKIPSEPIIFLKPNTSVIGPNTAIIYPKGVRRLDYEAELAIVIRKKCKNISETDVPKYILGYTCLNDVTARDLQKKDGQWARAKSFDTFCPIGPWVQTRLDPSNLDVMLYLNGKLKQRSSTAHFIFSPKHLVSFVSKIMTLMPGDVISTGTPAGVGPMKRGDKVEVEVEGIGKLRNHVI